MSIVSSETFFTFSGASKAPHFFHVNTSIKWNPVLFIATFWSLPAIQNIFHG
jgi:hypothetical protein